MKLSSCVGCDRPVLELAGQFELLNSFYLEPGGPDPRTAGAWHLRCLLESPHGEAWCDARLRNHLDVRRNDRVATLDGWAIVRNPRTHETLAFARTGESLPLRFAGRPRRVDGGLIYPIDEEYNLELDDRDVIASIQASLTSGGTFPLAELMDALGIADRTAQPQALEGGVFRYERSLRGEWTPEFVSARAAYGVYVPAALEPFVEKPSR